MGSAIRRLFEANLLIDAADSSNPNPAEWTRAAVEDARSRTEGRLPREELERRLLSLRDELNESLIRAQARLVLRGLGDAGRRDVRIVFPAAAAKQPLRTCERLLGFLISATRRRRGGIPSRVCEHGARCHPPDRSA
jgi:hypothetical protein